MKRKGIILGFVVLFVAAALLYSKIALTENIRANKADESINFYTNPGGTGLVKKGEITPDGELRVDTIEDLAGSGTPPGMVPVGGMVAVMPSTHANAWVPPDTGVIKDGFMRANGHVITAQNVTDGSLFPAGTALPDMRNRFTRGSPDATSGTASGNDSVTPSGTVSQPSFNGVAVTRSTWFKNQSISATMKGHYHDMSGAGTTLDVPAYDYGTGDFTVSVANYGDGGVNTTSVAANTHTHTVYEHYHSESGPGAGIVVAKNQFNISYSGTTRVKTNGPSNQDLIWAGNLSAPPFTYANVFDVGENYSLGYHMYVDLAHSHSWTGDATTSGTVGDVNSGRSGDANMTSGNNSASTTVVTDIGHGHTASVSKSNFDHDHNITGRIGKYTSGCDGNTDGACGVTFNVNNDNMSEWSASGDYTPSGSVSQPTFSGNSQDNKPAYTTVVWVIRVM